jgi:hypothetical protein
MKQPSIKPLFPKAQGPLSDIELLHLPKATLVVEGSRLACPPEA